MVKFIDIFELSQHLKNELPKDYLPPAEGTNALTEMVIANSFFKNTRGYIEKVVNQINGCYEKGWFDSCAVMMRRLLETLIIEVFESYKIDSKIKNGNGDFLYLSDLVSALQSETSWNLGRNTKKVLPALKAIGDYSAHSRRYVAHRKDIDDVKNDFRLVTQELVFLAKLK